MIASALYKGNGGGPAGRIFAEQFLTGEQMSDDLRVRRTRGRTCNELLSQRNQPTRQTTLYVPLRIFGCLQRGF